MSDSISVGDQHKTVIGAVEEGNAFLVQRCGEDDHGKSWGYGASAGGKRPRWFHREFIRCY